METSVHMVMPLEQTKRPLFPISCVSERSSIFGIDKVYLDEWACPCEFSCLDLYCLVPVLRDSPPLPISSYMLLMPLRPMFASSVSSYSWTRVVFSLVQFTPAMKSSLLLQPSHHLAWTTLNLRTQCKETIQTHLNTQFNETLLVW